MLLGIGCQPAVVFLPRRRRARRQVDGTEPPWKTDRIIAGALVCGPPSRWPRNGSSAAGTCPGGPPVLQAHFSGAQGNRCRGTRAASVPGVNVKIPATHVVWDNSVCHTYWQTPYGRGNVPMSDGPVSEIWDGPDPPPYFEPVCVPFVPPVNCRPN